MYPQGPIQSPPTGKRMGHAGPHSGRRQDLCFHQPLACNPALAPHSRRSLGWSLWPQTGGWSTRRAGKKEACLSKQPASEEESVAHPGRNPKGEKQGVQQRLQDPQRGMSLEGLHSQLTSTTVSPVWPG